MAYISTGVVQRPAGTTALKIVIQNTGTALTFQSISVYDWDSGSAVLINAKNYFVPGNATNTAEIPLVIGEYGDILNVQLYEVVYGPTSPTINVTITNI